MVLEYFNYKHYKKDKGAGQTDAPLQSPVLKEEDERFLHRITSEEAPPPLPDRPTIILDNGEKVKGKDAQIALMAGADQIPLPRSPPVDDESQESSEEEKDKVSPEERKRRDYWSYLPSLPLRTSKAKAQERTAADLQAALEVSKAGGVELVPEAEDGDAQKEKDELTSILDRLNLSAFNNKLFSLSKDSEKLMDEFTQILKDIINGVPTAYDDLEKLLTGSEKQLQQMYGSMPPFLQTLVKSLPAKMTSTLGPELLAVASEKPGVKAQGVASGSSTQKEQKKSKKSRIPSLKTLVSEKGVAATMLRSILNFLKLRFPAFVTGTNVLMSLAVFLLLFVFWYCHKRGKETRLEKERIGGSTDLEQSTSDLENSTAFEESSEKLGASTTETSSESIRELPSVLNLPDPKSVSLPEDHADFSSKKEPELVKT